MAMTYFDISKDEAIELLQKIPDKELNILFDLYGISDYNIQRLADLVPDYIILSLYNENNLSGNEDSNLSIGNIMKKEYNNSIEDIKNFLLNDIDPYILQNLYNKFNTNNVEDIAIAITDSELEKLGFDNPYNFDTEEVSTDIDKYTTSYDDLLNPYSYGDYDEEFDYLEDIDHDIPYMYVDDNYFITTDENTFNRFKDCIDSSLVSICEPVSELNDYKIGKEDINNYFWFKVLPKVYDNDDIEIREDVVINDKLNPEIFDENHIMKVNVKELIMDYVNNFIELMNQKGIDVDYTDIQLVGSNAGYLYQPNSDIDIHFIWSFPMDKDKFDAMRAEFMDYTTNNPLIIGDDSVVELNLEDNFNMEANSGRRYSLLTDTWVDDSDKNENYTIADMEQIKGYEDVVKHYSDVIDDIISSDSYADALELKQEIRKNRSDDLKNIGALSLGNVVFKELRQNGKFGELRNYIKDKEIENDVM